MLRGNEELTIMQKLEIRKTEILTVRVQERRNDYQRESDRDNESKREGV
jgi:hypothetical protein